MGTAPEGKELSLVAGYQDGLVQPRREQYLGGCDCLCLFPLAVGPSGQGALRSGAAGMCKATKNVKGKVFWFVPTQFIPLSAEVHNFQLLCTTTNYAMK